MIITLTVVVYGCSNDKSINEPFSDPNSLQSYINGHAGLHISDRLIACAGGGNFTYLTDPAFPVSIFFVPEPGAHDFLYFESENISADNENFELYVKMELSDEPIFNGYLRKFLRGPVSKNVWCRVTFIKDDSLHISNAIRIKYSDKPTEFNPGLVQVDSSNKLEPIFKWQDGSVAENEIYFQVVANSSNDLLSGTYTYETQFQFYNISNVVLNIRDVTPPPFLRINKNYSFTLMGISIDNWVNLLARNDFTTIE